MDPLSSQLPHHHVVMFPFMAQGHTIPLLDMSKAFSHRGLMVTIITTPSNSSTISKYIQTHSNIHVKVIPFPSTPDLPNGCENTSQLPSMSLIVPFLRATLQLQKPFEEKLQDMSRSGSLPICVISDFFFSWTVPICRKFGVPSYVFHGMGVFSMALTKAIAMHVPLLMIRSETEPIHIPGLELPFSFTLPDIPHLLGGVDQVDPLSKFVREEIIKWEVQSSGIIVNSFMELESEHVSSLESFYHDGCKAWCVGPILLYNEMDGVNWSHDLGPSDPYIKWLDDRDAHKSVLYVSFGTQAYVSDKQLDEIAYGLEMSGHPFMWIVRSKTWALPDGLEKKTKGRGLIGKDWVDQRSILAHHATGGFLSHCGWNSVLESLCMGIPLITWPIMAEQPLNAKFVVEVLKAGLQVPIKSDGIIAVDRFAICDVVKKLMGSDVGKQLKEKAEALGKLAKQALQKGGSSHKNLNDLLEGLCANFHEMALNKILQTPI